MIPTEGAMGNSYARGPFFLGGATRAYGEAAVTTAQRTPIKWICKSDNRL